MINIPNNISVITLNKKGIVDFAAERNLLLNQADTEWVLFIDQDEEINERFAQEISSAVKKGKFNVYDFPRQDLFLGQLLNYGENGSNRFIRLMRVGIGQFVRPVHEIFVTKEKIGHLNSPIIHHLPGISGMLDKINNYTELEASFRYKSGQRATMFHLILFPVAKLFTNLIIRRGILDGVPGFIMAALMSFHSYLTWTKLYLLAQKKCC